MTLRILLISDALGPPVRGNGTTIARWMGSLMHHGVDVRAVPPGAAAPPGFAPHVIHAYHALRGGPSALQLAAEHRRPLIVSLGGTDLWALREGHDEAPCVARVLREADLVLGAFPQFGDAVQQALHAPVPYASVRRGVYLEDVSSRRERSGPLRVLLPAGLRPVKDPLLAFTLADELRGAGLDVQLRLLGPALDAGTAREVRTALETRAWARWESLPLVAMGGAYQGADVVWNTSLHEGGANALLEGLANGCAVCARRVHGNLELLGGEQAPGLLFEPADLAALLDLHRELLQETQSQREARRARTHEWLMAHHSPAAELADLLAAYARVGAG